MKLAHPKVAQPNWGPFGLESAIDFDHPSGTNARCPSQKAGEAIIPDRWVDQVVTKKRTRQIVDHKVKIKENEKKNK